MRSVDETRAAVIGGRARAVLLYIGDGMADSEITMARNYAVGASGRLSLDTLPMTGECTTYAVQEANPALSEYVPDSASTATAWATGHKTSNGRISTVAGSRGVAVHRTILEIARERGYRTGNVTTAELTDATPAALMSHVDDRRCQGPQDMKLCPAYRKASGGPGSIAEQAIDHHVDVLLGGGRKRFEQAIESGPEAGRTVAETARAQGYTYVTDAEGLAAARPQGRLLGLFKDGTMTPEWKGEPARPFPGSGPQRCVEGVRAATTKEPSLSEMTTKALEVLDGLSRRSGRTGPGFFLQVEGASIDKQEHAENPCGQIGETVAFDKAVAVGLAYARTHPATLVVVTGDHAHTSQIIEPVPTDAVDHPGSFSVLTTVEGAPMTVAYGTEPHGTSQDHTGTQLRIAAQGPQAAGVAGVIDQTDLFHVLARALGAE